MGYRKGYYRKDGTYVQGHFTNTRSRSYSNKNKGCMLIVLLAMTLGLGISCSDSSDGSNENTTDISGSTGNSSNSSNSNCPTKTCGDFKTQPQAQATFESNKTCYKNLDGDGNGRACENLPKK
ncbi:excalibur calcium-binding domain-containing protein [Flavobacterium psychroterrae]|nr:excalibur calcium-binding domain-containing protein [Flavobacterium psychroterrae]